jgi:hypothetical protein
MLEKTRVVRRPEGEPNFNIFYQMLSGLDPKTRRDLNLESLNDPNLFMTPLQRVSKVAAMRRLFECDVCLKDFFRTNLFKKLNSEKKLCFLRMFGFNYFRTEINIEKAAFDI